ncbi:MAG: response regulator [Candidatus Baltobacteraceae bacterium]
MRILLADDAAVVREVFARIVAPAGYELVGWAGEASQAAALAARLAPDVVAIDSRLPPAGGLEALARIRAAAPAAALVLVAAAGEQQLVREGLAAGARGTLLRPLLASQVLGVLAGLARTEVRGSER